jgi:NDP-sugar pyrophosphorylase family protein
MEDYLDVLRSWHAAGSLCGAGTLDPFAERCQTGFAVIEEGGRVEEGARLHDAVVMAGGVVERGATVIRSVVGRGGVIPAGRRIVGTLILPAVALEEGSRREGRGAESW